MQGYTWAHARVKASLLGSLCVTTLHAASSRTARVTGPGEASFLGRIVQWRVISACEVLADAWCNYRNVGNHGRLLWKGRTSEGT